MEWTKTTNITEARMRWTGLLYGSMACQYLRTLRFGAFAACVIETQAVRITSLLRGMRLSLYLTGPEKYTFGVHK